MTHAPGSKELWRPRGDSNPRSIPGSSFAPSENALVEETRGREPEFCAPEFSSVSQNPTPEQRADDLLQHLIDGWYQFPVDVGPARRAFLERVESLRHVDREPCHRCGHVDWFVPEHRAYKVCNVCRSTEMLRR